jgi:glutathione synthase/RimK-type ligase-like ATP-grasp enzyme
MTTKIAMLYDRSETDELGIQLTAVQMGVELGFLPFHKVALGFDSGGFSYRSLGKDYTEELRDVRVVLNRAQSKSRRMFAASILGALGKEVLNPMPVELNCQSKIRALLAFTNRGVLVPKTVYVPCNTEERVGGGGVRDNSETVSRLIAEQMGSDRMVVKPDAGTHGMGVSLSESREDLQGLLRDVKPSITNPVGVVAQEFIPKWFYDLRIIVRKERGRPPSCHGNALARGGFKEFRTNTFLGNMVFRARLPAEVMRQAEACAEALGEGGEAWVIALDAMPRIGEDLREGEEEVRASIAALDEPFREVTRVKRLPSKKRDFAGYTKAITEAYEGYMATEAYARVEAVVNETLERARGSVYFHEGNACPEFWEQTRVVAGINPAEDMLMCAQGLLDA